MLRCDRCGVAVESEAEKLLHFHGFPDVRLRTPEPPRMQSLGTVEPIEPPPQFARAHR